MAEHRRVAPPSTKEDRRRQTNDLKKAYSIDRRLSVSYWPAPTSGSYGRVSDAAGTTEQFVRSEFNRKTPNAASQRYLSLEPDRVCP